MRTWNSQTYYFVLVVCSAWLLLSFCFTNKFESNKVKLSQTERLRRTEAEPQSEARIEKDGPMRGQYYGSIENILVGVRDWEHGIRLGKWNQSVLKINGTFHDYNEHWKNILEMFTLKDCNAVDVGANDGKNHINKY